MLGFNRAVLIVAAACTGLCACTTDAPALRAAADTDAVHREALTLDTHVDIPLDFATAEVDPLDGELQVNLQKMVAGGLDAAFFIVYVGQTARTDANYLQAQTDARTKFAAIHRMTDELYADRIELAYTVGDAQRIAEAGKLVAAIGIENGYVIGKDLRLLDEYHALGARYLTLVHNGDNDIAHSAQPRPELGDLPAEGSAGVTQFGAEVIERLNLLGIMVDVSHGSKQTALDAIRLSEAPVIASHSGVAGVANHPRNMDDETLLALRLNGGVIQIVGFDGFLKVQPEERRTAVSELAESLGLTGPIDDATLAADLQAAYRLGLADIDRRWPPATVADMVDHIDYAVRLIGVDHVGISSDFGGGGGIVGWEDASETSNITRELQARGYDEQQIRKIWSGNLLRVWRDVERVAAQLTRNEG